MISGEVWQKVPPSQSPPARQNLIVSLVSHNTRDCIPRRIVPCLDCAKQWMLKNSFRLLRIPVSPLFHPGISAVEDEASAGREMMGDGSQDGLLTWFRDKYLEGMSGQKHQIEFLPKPDIACIRFDP